MDFSIEQLHAVERDMKSKISKVLEATNGLSTGDLTQGALNKLTKSTLSDFVRSLVSTVECNIELCKSAASKIDAIQTEQIETQKKMLDLQREQMGTVDKTVKTELKSWADVVTSKINQTQSITTTTVKEAVRTVNDEEHRSKNYIIYGYDEIEDAEEDPREIVKEVYEKAGCLVPEILDIYRIGKKTSGKTRPIKVEMSDSGDVRFILKHAYKLRESNLRSVYVAPDRTREERIAHSNLVKEMKELIRQFPSKHYIIRNNKVVCSDKTLSSGVS